VRPRGQSDCCGVGKRGGAWLGEGGGLGRCVCCVGRVRRLKDKRQGWVWVQGMGGCGTVSAVCRWSVLNSKVTTNHSLCIGKDLQHVSPPPCPTPLATCTPLQYP